MLRFMFFLLVKSVYFNDKQTEELYKEVVHSSTQW